MQYTLYRSESSDTYWALTEPRPKGVIYSRIYVIVLLAGQLGDHPRPEDSTQRVYNTSFHAGDTGKTKVPSTHSIVVISPLKQYTTNTKHTQLSTQPTLNSAIFSPCLVFAPPLDPLNQLPPLHLSSPRNPTTLNYLPLPYTHPPWVLKYVLHSPRPPQPLHPSSVPSPPSHSTPSHTSPSFPSPHPGPCILSFPSQFGSIANLCRRNAA